MAYFTAGIDKTKIALWFVLIKRDFCMGFKRIYGSRLLLVETIKQASNLKLTRLVCMKIINAKYYLFLNDGDPA